MKSALIYSRTAVRQQDLDDSAAVKLTAQRQTCQKLADDQGWTVIGEHSDDGYSANDLSRPGLTALLDSLQDTPVDYVITACRDRLSRSPVADRQIERQITELGAELVATHDDFWRMP